MIALNNMKKVERRSSQCTNIHSRPSHCLLFLKSSYSLAELIRSMISQHKCPRGRKHIGKSHFSSSFPPPFSRHHSITECGQAMLSSNAKVRLSHEITLFQSPNLPSRAIFFHISVIGLFLLYNRVPDHLYIYVV